jgi:hypothetical protein
VYPIVIGRSSVLCCVSVRSLVYVLMYDISMGRSFCFLCVSVAMTIVIDVGSF